MAPRNLVPPPNFTPRGRGLLSVVQPRFDEADPHWRNGVVYQPQCGDADTTYDPCVSVDGAGEPVPAPPEKTATAELVARGATPFAVYAEIDCNPVGWWDEAQQRAEQALARAEEWQVERAFWTGLAANQQVVHPHLAADSDLETDDGVRLQTAATVVVDTVVGVPQGLGLLEQALADCYKGVGVIHVPEQLIPLLADAQQIIRQGEVYRTWNGNLVAAGSGYPGSGPDGSTPADGSVWMYATGAVFAYRSRPMVIPPEEGAFDHRGNTVKVLTERTYVLGWDCCHLAVQVDATGSTGLSPNDINAAELLVWDPDSETMSLEPGDDGQVLSTDDGTPRWVTPGTPGQVAGPLDGSGRIPASQLPPAELHTTFVADSEAEMLSDAAEAPSICVRTDFDPPQLFMLAADPASDIGNWHSIGAIGAFADPTGQVGTTSVNGTAGTYMRSDAAPAIDQGIEPTWAGQHTFQAGATLGAHLHMSEQRIVNLGDPQQPRDAVNLETMQSAITDAVDGLPEQPVTSVNGQTGDVTLAASDVGADTSGAANAVQGALDTHTAEQGAIGQHVPVGGTEGQVLTMGAAGSVGWQDPPSAGGNTTVVTHDDGDDVNLIPGGQTVNLVDTSNADETVTVHLPDAGDDTASGTVFTVKLIGGDHSVFIQAGGASIDGSASVGLNGVMAFRTFVFDGANWFVIAQSSD